MQTQLLRRSAPQAIGGKGEAPLDVTLQGGDIRLTSDGVDDSRAYALAAAVLRWGEIPTVEPPAGRAATSARFRASTTTGYVFTARSRTPIVNHV